MRIRKIIVALLVSSFAAASASAVVMPDAEGRTLDAPGVGTFVVTGCGPGLVLRLYAGDEDFEGLDSAPDIYGVECDVGLLYWDDGGRELFYWKSDDGGYSIWVWRPGGSPALVAWSWTRPAYTAEGVDGGPRPASVRWLPDDE
ncbi:MAG: hypothetical protein PVH29_05045 [Candidatus Zixiibacteriota bacterium]|jgi:hypothetical protein